MKLNINLIKISLKAQILQKRKNRAAKTIKNDENSDNGQAERPLSREDKPLENLIPRIIANNEKSEINRGYNDEGDQIPEDDFDNGYQDPLGNASSPQIIQTAIINKHRDKSRELLKNVKDDDPNKVVDELHDVRDRIKDKIKGNMLEQLSIARSESEKKDDLKLDLTSSTIEPTQGFSTGRESLQQKIKRIQQQAGEKTNAYRTFGGAKRETTRFDEVGIIE